MWYTTATVFYPFTETVEAEAKIKRDGITLASANAGVLEGEKRTIHVWTSAEDARQHYPFNAIAECHVLATNLRNFGAQLFRRCDITDTLQPTAAVSHTLDFDIPAHAIVAIHPSLRTLTHSSGDKEQPHPFSEEGALLIETGACAIALLRGVYTRMAAQMHSIYKGGKRQADGALAWHDYYKTMPALQTFVAAHKNQVPDETIARQEEASEREVWFKKLSEAQRQVALLPVGFNDQYIMGVEGVIQAARNRVSAASTAIDVQMAMGGVELAIGQLADHQEMLMGVYAGVSMNGAKTKERGASDQPVILDFPKHNW